MAGLGDSVRRDHGLGHRRTGVSRKRHSSLIEVLQEQRGQAREVLCVVLANASEQGGAATTEVGQPRGRGFAAGQVVFADDAQPLPFDGRQPAVR